MRTGARGRPPARPLLQTVVLREYDPRWPSAFDALASELRAVLGSAIVRIHHVGSTSVPGLRAKPVIDVLLEATSLVDLDECEEDVVAAGFEWRGEYGLPDRRYIPKRHPDWPNHPDWPMNHAHVHCWAAGHPEIARHLRFRDALRASEATRDAYAALKTRLRDEFEDDRFAYTDAKTEFIVAVEQGRAADVLGG